MNASTKQNEGLGKYMPLAFAAGIGSMLGSGIIVGLSSTITVWQDGLGLDTTQVGLLSGILTFAIAFGSLFGGRLADKIGRVLFFNWINLVYAIGAVICIFAGNFTTLLVGLIIAGLASGADLPVSMTVVSHDAPDDATAARLVSTTQVFWQVGVFISFICAVPPAVASCSPFSLYSPSSPGLGACSLQHSVASTKKPMPAMPLVRPLRTTPARPR